MRKGQFIRSVRKYGSFWMVISCIVSCKHTFDPPTITATNRLLVVEGLINVGTDATTKIHLSRVQNIKEANTSVPELYAKVSIETQGGEILDLDEQANSGDYLLSHSNLTAGTSYRLNISTTSGQYLSDFVPAKSTPPIDSLQWDQNTDVFVYVNTHDPLDSTRYYRWDYEETWNYASNMTTPWAINGTMVYAKDSTNQTDSCWRTDYSTSVSIATSVALSKDVISHFQVASVPNSDERISQRYSILVKQYALTKEAYEFHRILQKNTEQTGSLFDPQPSNLSSNIHCISNPNEQVIGYISASTVTEMRIFIQHQEVKNWDYHGSSINCDQKNIPISDETTFPTFNYPDTSYGVYFYVFNSPELAIAKKACMSCLYFGGTNQKPSFW